MDKVKKKFEFSKLLVIIAIVIFAGYGMYSGIEYYRLIQLAMTCDNMYAVVPDSSLAVSCVGGILGSILTYVLYQGSLKLSLNANKLRIDQVTGIVRRIADGDAKEAVIDAAEINAEEKVNIKEKTKESKKTKKDTR